MSDSRQSRREFVSTTSKLALGATIVPRRVLGGPGYQAPSDTLNLAIVGAGGQGIENAEQLRTENIVALCDIDFGYVERRLEEKQKNREGEARPEGVRLKELYDGAKRYDDFRRMLEEQPDIDAVVVATPDHLHAVIAKAAMEMGKHVYVQKPLTWSVHEARVLSRVAQSTGVVTQMGNQGHSNDDARVVNEWVQAGIIGPVREVHVWTNRPIWPQGVPQPAESNRVEGERNWGRGGITRQLAAALGGKYNKPRNVNWEMYLGPIAEDIPYHPMYHPFNWRGWTAFGVGALGDMGAHLIDHPFWALDLGYPTSIEATSSPWGGPSADPDSYPLAMTAHYEFPRRGLQPPVRMNWYDGGLMPPRPDVLPDTHIVDGEEQPLELVREGGVIMIGERGILMHETYGRNPMLFPESLREEAARVPQTYARVEGSHEMNWARACKGEIEAVSPIPYGAKLTEVMLLGIVALRTGQGRTIYYDGEQGRVTNVPEANDYLTRDYREGWAV
jgi:predicted dehydrogenase